MKKRILLFFALFLSLSFAYAQEYLRMIDKGTHLVQDVIDNAEAYFADKDKGRGSGYKQFKRWEYMSKRLMNEDGYLPSITDNMRELERQNAYLNEVADSRQSVNDNWEELGPTVLDVTGSWTGGVGRVTGIAIDEANTNHLIIGAHTGGVWRSIDDGQSWTALTDNFNNLSVYSVAMDPDDSDTYFFGSSSGLIFKSEDAGATWNELADISNSQVNKILINPDNTDIIFASIESSGLYRSTDAGATWTKVSPPDEDFSFDVEFRPGDTSVVYASGAETYRSTNGGATFTQLSVPVVDPNDFAAVMIGMSPDNPDVIYLLRGNLDFRGLFKSENGGDTFVQLAHPNRNFLNPSMTGTGTGGQAPRDMDIVVNPTNVDEVHIAGVNVWRSMDGGDTFEISAHWFAPQQVAANVGYCHADIDFLTYSGTSSAMYAATDGGIFRAPNSSADISVDYFEDLTNGIGIRQFYLIDVSQSSTNIIAAGGSQDNGSSIYRENTNDFVEYIGADGGGTIVRRANPNQVFGTLQFGTIFRTSTAGNNLINVNTPPGQGNFVTPMEEDPINSDIYIGYNRVFRSSNSGGIWTGISQVFPGLIADLKVANSNNQVAYAVVGSRLFRTENGGATNWTQVSSPGGTINSVAIHPRDPNMIAIATNNAARVRISTDGGQTWQSCFKNLPNFQALSLIWDDNDKDGLYLGMNFGVYYIDNQMDEWQVYNNNLPNVIVNNLAINNETDMLYAGTFGRGMWRSPLVEDGVLASNDFSVINNLVIAPNPAFDQVSISLNQSLEADVRVFDLTGKLLIYKEDVAIEGNYTLDVSSLLPGVYFVRVNTPSGIATERLVIE